VHEKVPSDADESTTSDVTGLGLHVVCAVIPGCQPLLLGARMQPRGGERLLVARESGHLNDLPHPFAANGFYND